MADTRNLPYGQERWHNGTLPTDYRWTGQRLSAELGLYQMGARWYDSYLNRWIQPDTIIPQPSNPQSLNRYSYCLGNPLKFVDPSGHDPLDAAWQAEFEKIHGYAPTAEDMLIRLFSIAFPGEWNNELYNQLYTADGKLDTTAFERLFDNIPAGRDWAGMPGATGHMAGWYKKGETGAFIRDIGSLFAGLLTRFEAGWARALTGGVAHRFVSIGKKGLPEELIGNDRDGNIAHWAWTLNLGYFDFVGRQDGRKINTLRELTDPNQTGVDYNADVKLGGIGVAMGSYMGRGLLPSRSPLQFQNAWQLMPLQVSQ